MVFALALTSQLAEGFLAPTGVGKQVEARTGQVSCLLGRRQVATSAALLALGSYAGEAQASGTKLSLEEQRELAGLGPIRKADQSKIGVSSVPIPTVGKKTPSPTSRAQWTPLAGRSASPRAFWDAGPSTPRSSGLWGS